MERRVVLTGGGTAGHVMPNVALLPELYKRGFSVYYIGGAQGMEKGIITPLNVPYSGISAGKLRRYLSLANITDAFRVIKGVADARKALKEIRPLAVFSKGGFVTVPVVAAARTLKIPVIIHESDMTPGLANRIALPLARRICVTFPETADKLPKGKTVVTGAPIREELFRGSGIEGRKICGFEGARPVMLVIGGSLGSAALNGAVRAALPDLAGVYDVAHICGKGRADAAAGTPGYRQFEFADKELPHLYAAADIVVSRAGSSVINELLALRRPNLLIPLSKKASRGDQILNAASFEARGFSMVLSEGALTPAALVMAVNDLYENRGKYSAAMKGAKTPDAAEIIAEIIAGATSETDE
jgi:UDP-N-acetylglucosamine--N-acetylmuramyl-(pentapeptide) pyrophosphoryl-undecaprenol N-acetylglucosamine transferase